MKNFEFYIKYKTGDRPTIDSSFNKINWWHIVVPTLGAVLVGPLIVYKRQRSIPLSLHHYVQLLTFCLVIAVPFILFFIWLHWRESIKRNSGYGWIGKFEVIKKQSFFVFCYLLLSPGNSKLKVERTLFEKMHTGNFILIRRDALGKIEEIRKINYRSNRVFKAGIKRFLKRSLKS